MARMPPGVVVCPRCGTKAECWTDQHFDTRRVYTCGNCQQRVLLSTHVEVHLAPPKRLPYVPVTSLDVGKELIVVEVTSDDYEEWHREFRGTITAVEEKRFHLRVKLPDGSHHLTMSRKTGVETRMYQMDRAELSTLTWFRVDGGEDPSAMEGIAPWP